MHTILVVDDDPEFQILMRTMLEKQGMHVVSATASHEALNRARSIKPDLVLMDIFLPGERASGWQAIAAIRADHKLRDTPIIVVTAHEQPGDPQRTDLLRCQGYFRKPFDVFTLLDSISIQLT